MDVRVFAHDIDELVDAFFKVEGTELSTFKELWQGRSFSFIHEARPNNANPAFFMQTVYSCALNYFDKELPLQKKLGGLYALYALYGTQQFKPPFKIYLSMEDLEGLYSVVLDAKSKGIAVAVKVVQTMMSNDMFLFGSVAVNQKKIAVAAQKLARQAVSRLQYARKRFLSETPIEQHLTGNLVTELGLNELTLLYEECTFAKQRALKVATNGVKDVNAIVNMDEVLLGEELKKDTEAWIEHRKTLCDTKDDDIDDAFVMELNKALEQEEEEEQ